MHIAIHHRLARRAQTKPHRRARKLKFASLIAGLVSAALLLTGCGSGSHQAQVASLPGPGSSNAHAATTSSLSANTGVPDPQGRPRQPLDATAKQEGALYNPYLACLRAHNYVDQITTNAKLAVNAKCEKLEPLAPWQLDPANPQARAFIGRTVSCLEARGYHARATLVTNIPIEPPEWFVKYSPNRLNYTPNVPTAAQNACQQQALR